LVGGAGAGGTMRSSGQFSPGMQRIDCDAEFVGITATSTTPVRAISHWRVTIPQISQ
jgi:hypothetical protein